MFPELPDNVVAPRLFYLRARDAPEPLAVRWNPPVRCGYWVAIEAAAPMVVLLLGKFAHQLWSSAVYETLLAVEEEAREAYAGKIKEYEEKKLKADKKERQLLVQFQRKAITRAEYEKEIENLEAELGKFWLDEVVPLRDATLKKAQDRDWIGRHRPR